MSMSKLAAAACLSLVLFTQDAVAQIDNGDGTVTAIKNGSPVRVVKAKKWFCGIDLNNESSALFSGTFDQLISENYSDQDRIDKKISGTFQNNFNYIPSNVDSIVYKASPKSGEHIIFHQYIINLSEKDRTWILIINLSPSSFGSASYFQLVENDQARLAGSCKHSEIDFDRKLISK